MKQVTGGRDVVDVKNSRNRIKLLNAKINATLGVNCLPRHKHSLDLISAERCEVKSDRIAVPLVAPKEKF